MYFSKEEQWAKAYHVSNCITLWCRFLENIIHLARKFPFMEPRVLGYRSGGPGSIPGTTKKKCGGSGTGSTQPREYN
jgi:hypothetical protein